MEAKITPEWSVFKPKEGIVIRRQYRDEQGRRVTEFVAFMNMLKPFPAEERANQLVLAINVHDDLLAALEVACAHCGSCGGTGTAYTMEDETDIGQPPGSSAIDCPECQVWREAIIKASG